MLRPPILAARFVFVGLLLSAPVSIHADGVNKVAVRAFLAEIDGAQAPGSPEGARITAEEARKALTTLRSHGAPTLEAAVLALGTERTIPAVKKGSVHDGPDPVGAVKAHEAVLLNLDGNDPAERLIKLRSALDVARAICAATAAMKAKEQQDVLYFVDGPCLACNQRYTDLSAAGADMALLVSTVVFVYELEMKGGQRDRARIRVFDELSSELDKKRQVLEQNSEMGL